MVGINIESSAVAVAQSVEFGAEDLHSNITGGSTKNSVLKYKILGVLHGKILQKEILSESLHRGEVGSSVPGHSLNVRVHKASDLQV